MESWDRSTIDCTECGGTAAARTNQWGKTTHYECRDCGAKIDAGTEVT